MASTRRPASSQRSHQCNANQSLGQHFSNNSIVNTELDSKLAYLRMAAATTEQADVANKRFPITSSPR